MKSYDWFNIIERASIKMVDALICVINKINLI